MPTFEKFFRWLFSARILIRIGGGVLAFMVVAAVLWNAFDVSGHKRWLAWKAEWEAKGESFNPESIIPEAIPDEQTPPSPPCLSHCFRTLIISRSGKKIGQSV